MRNSKLKVLLVSLAILLNTNHIFAKHKAQNRGNTTVDVISHSITVGNGTTKTVDLSHTTYIKNLIVSAQGTSRSGATMQVIVNGDVKGTIHVPGYDPSYFVTIKEKTDSIQFQSLSGTIKIFAIKVVGHGVRSRSNTPWKNGTRYSSGMYGENAGTLAQDIALTAIDLVNEFTKYSSYKELGDILLPIKKAAASVYAISYGAGDYSVRMRNSLLALSNELKMARSFINTNFERSALFDLALELLTLKERLDYIIK